MRVSPAAETSRVFTPRNARALAWQCLNLWQQSERFAAEIFAQEVQLAELKKVDQAFARELFYGCLRNLTALDFLLHGFIRRPPAPEALNVLRLGVYQLFIIDTAEHAAINETVELVDRHSRGFINAVLRGALRDRAGLREKLDQQPLSTRFSHPAGLLQRWQKTWGEPAVLELLRWNNTPAEVFVRLNTLRTSREALLQAVPHLVPQSHPLSFRCDGPLPEGDAAHLIYVQDPGTLAAPDLLAPRPGERILDACAAPGGKTTCLAALMQNEGEILATDASTPRLETLRRNLQNLGVTLATVRQHDWEAGSGALAGEKFDAILADVPCSNTGVMRRRIDVRWRLRPDLFAQNAVQQRRLVEHLLPHLRPGGRLVYSTCSLEPEENEQVVQAVLQAHPELQLTQEIRRLPQRDACDGAYAALLTIRKF